MKISIVTVVYNNEETIKDAILSVANQSYENIEYIVIDGASTDGTLGAITKLQDKTTEFISEPDEGIYDAMNKGIKLATGDVIGILNSDDFYSNNQVISEVAEVFDASPELDMVMGNVDFVHADNLSNPVRFYSSAKFSPWKLKFGFMPAHPATFIKRSAYDKVGSYKLGYKIAADFDMFVRLLLIDQCKYKVLNQALVRMRLGGVSTSGIRSYYVASKEMVRSLKENGLIVCWPCILFRLPVKLFQLLKFRLTQ